MAGKITSIITLIVFIISAIAFVASAYGLGVEEKDKTSPAYNASISFLVISIVGMLVSWLFAWKLQIPLDPIQFEGYFAEVK